MKQMTTRALALTGVLAIGLTAAHAQSDGALLDALVKKGVLSDQEAEDVRAAEAKDYGQTSASKLSISNHVTNLKLYGDGRLRYEYINEKAQDQNLSPASGPNSSTVDRSRYRLRIGADYTFTDNFKAGVELESGSAADSANQNFGGEFGKYNINIGLIYLEWKPTDWATLTGGKQRNPLYTTDLVWDPDINPEGGSEALNFNVNDQLSVGFTAGQFIYADNNEYNTGAFSGTAVPSVKSDIWMFAEQVPVQFNFDKDTYIKEVPSFTSYLGGGYAPPSGNNSGIYANNSAAPSATGTVGNGTQVSFASPYAADDLQLIGAPGEFDFKLAEIPFKVYWDFQYNLDAHERVQNVYLGQNYVTTPAAIADQNANGNLSDGIAWVAGLQIGQNKKKGDWSVKGDFRQVGLGSEDPNINDSDWGDSYLNQQGVKIQAQYNFTDFVTGSLTFIDTWAYKSNLMNGSPGQVPTAVPLGGTGGTPVGGAVVANVLNTAATNNLVGAHTTQRIEADLNWKF